ncbi:MAG: hypothetical protein JW807_12840 [Spirochaetes bacterium]|nr:hypothetical protein [Spirochaetota bacterium]
MFSTTKFKIAGIVFVVILILGSVIFFRYLFTYEQRQQLQRKIGSVTGQNMTVTVFGFDGRIIKRWVGIEKITSGYTRAGSGERAYTYFYTKQGKYVQLPDSVWYIAEEE